MMAVRTAEKLLKVGTCLLAIDSIVTHNVLKLNGTFRDNDALAKLHIGFFLVLLHVRKDFLCNCSSEKVFYITAPKERVLNLKLFGKQNTVESGYFKVIGIKKGL